jgi:hypothetical protein
VSAGLCAHSVGIAADDGGGGGAELEPVVGPGEAFEEPGSDKAGAPVMKREAPRTCGQRPAVWVRLYEHFNRNLEMSG